MNDSDVRTAAHAHIIKHHHKCDSTLVIDELGILHGKARIDIAVVNGSLIGYEIKSERDHLRRLPAQIVAYNSVFDELTIIVAETHLPQTLQVLPEWWGIIVCNSNDFGAIEFHQFRSPTENKSVDSLSLAQLLWKPETIELLRRLGYSGKELKGNRVDLYSKLISRLDLADLKNVVRDTIKARPNWRGHQPTS